MQMQTCKKCQKPAYHNKGISLKNNKPYENIKCSDRDCGHVEWINLEDKADKPKPEPANNDILNRIELKLDFIIDELNDKKRVHQSLGMKEVKNDEFEKVGDLIPKDKVDVKEIPF